MGISDTYVPSGSLSVNVSDASGFTVGENVGDGTITAIAGNRITFDGPITTISTRSTWGLRWARFPGVPFRAGSSNAVSNASESLRPQLPMS